jgi:hypothetical protein
LYATGPTLTRRLRDGFDQRLLANVIGFAQQGSPKFMGLDAADFLPGLHVPQPNRPFCPDGQNLEVRGKGNADKTDPLSSRAVREMPEESAGAKSRK